MLSWCAMITILIHIRLQELILEGATLNLVNSEDIVMIQKHGLF